MTRCLLYDPSNLAPSYAHPSAEWGFVPMACFREEDVRVLIGVRAVDAVCLVDPAPALAAEIHDLSPGLPLFILVPPEKLAAATGPLLAAGAHAVLPATLEMDTWHQVLRRHIQEPQRTGGAPGAAPSNRPKAGDMGPALAALREFSRLLAYSLNQESLVEHFIARLREMLGVSRVAIYLQAEGESDLSQEPGSSRAQRFCCAGSLGVPPGVAQAIALTRMGGLGRLLSRDSGVVRAGQALDDPRAQQELETLGCSYALPVCNLDGVMGIVVLGGMIAQTELADQELQLAFHLLEQLGQAIQNSRLHARLKAHHRLIKHVLDTVYAGVVVFNKAFEVVYSNAASERLLQPQGGRMAFALLPKEVAERVHEAVEHRRFAQPFVLGPSSSNPLWLRFTLVPLALEAEPKSAVSAMLVVEDHSQVRAAEKSAADTATASTISLLAERFAHEVRNSLTAIMAHGQMLDEAFDRPDFRQSMKSAIDGEGRRIGRLTQQLLLLATPGEKLGRSGERVSLPDVLQDAFQSARTQTDIAGKLVVEAEQGEWLVSGPRARLVHAFSELFLNSLQMTDNPSVAVSLRREGSAIRVAMRDSGPGFTPDTAARAVEPFYTTRTVGVGLGLTVAANIFNACGGSVSIQPRRDATSPDLFVSLPSFS